MTRMFSALLVFGLAGCGPGAVTLGGEDHSDAGGGGGGGQSVGGGTGGGGGGLSVGGGTGGGGSLGAGGGAAGGTAACPASPLPHAGAEAVLAPAFASAYSVFLLGAPPGVPAPLGGCLVRRADPNHLLIAGNSEAPTGGLYSIQISRDVCGHITGFVGTATRLADAPYIDANILEGADGTLLFSQWPVNRLSQLRPGANAPAATLDLTTLGIGTNTGSESPGGLGFVPPPLAGKGGLRSVTWPQGHWFHLDWTASNGTWTFPGATQAGPASSPLTGNPGGFAYVPAGSPGFAKQGLIVSEWAVSGTVDDRVAVYEVDPQGDPLTATRKEFFTKFPRPWGAYFEPTTGDYLFLTWNGGSTDRIYVVQGFEKPPPPPEIN